jgi:RNA polymerase sigma factor (sigma-70 family)
MRVRSAPILRALERKDWNQQTLALWLSCAAPELCNKEWSVATWAAALSMWINLKRSPPEEVALAICFALGEPYDKLWPESLSAIATSDIRTSAEVDVSPRELESISQRALPPQRPIEFELETEDLKRLLQMELNRLRPRDRCAIEARYIEGLNYEQVGERLGITRERARQICERGLDEIRKHMAKHRQEWCQ